ncbi:MAG: class I SAM-dependent methyltransferase [Bacteroidota bacterium]
MTKILKALRAFGLILKKPVLLNKVLQEPDFWQEHVKKKHGLGEGLPVLDPSALFGQEYSEELNIFTCLDGGSLITDIALLRGLARKFDECRYFEIGTWRGESAVNLAEICKEVFTLNLSKPEMQDLNIPEGVIDQQDMFSKDVDNIIHLKGNSRNYNYAAMAKKFDLIFIDGSHHYDDVKNDTEQVFTHLVHDNSIVVWHDYGASPDEVRFQVFAGLLDGLDREKHKHLYHVAHTKSAVYCKQAFHTEKLEKPFKPGFYYSVNLKYTPIEKG